MTERKIVAGVTLIQDFDISIIWIGKKHSGIMQ